MSKSSFKTGIFYSAVGKYGKLIIRMLVNIILARLLTPEDFGVVAIVQIFLTFFDMLADMGFGPAVIQNKTLDDKDLSVIFRFSIYVAFALAIIISLLGYPVNIFYSADIYIPIFLILGFNVFFYGLMVVPRALLLKEQNFKIVNIVEILANIANGIVSVILALMGFKYYAIIIGQIIKTFIMYIFYHTHTKVTAREKLSKEPILKIWAFARNQFAFNFINYFSRNLDSILIGRYMNSAMLGYYNKAYQVSLYPNQMLAGVITPVVQPILSVYENNLEVIENTYLRMVRLLANIGVPLSVFCFFAADNIVLFLFGNQWAQSVPVFRILSISIWEQMLASSTGSIYQSANRTDLLLFSGVQSTIFNVISIIIGVALGRIEYVAVMIVISFMLNFIVNNYLLMYRIFDSDFLELIKSMIKPVILGIIQVVLLWMIPDLPFNVFINLLIQGTVFVIGFIGGLFITKQFKELRKLIFN